MLVNEKIFREYDIRGVVGIDLDSELAYAIGRALAFVAKREHANSHEGKDSPMPPFGVGYDCRNSGPDFRNKLIAGLISQGVDALDCGMGPTPQLYHSVITRKLLGGVQITASHNPGDQNGFKMMIGQKTLSGEAIQEIRRLALSSTPSHNGSPGVCTHFDARSAYLDDLTERSLPLVSRERRLKVVVDGGNGVGGLVGPELLRRLGCDVIEVFTNPDGNFPNHHPDPTVLENLKDLQRLVLEHKADLGIAYDGDADRLGVVNEKAEPIFGDMLLIILGRQLLKEVAKPVIIADVKCSDLFFDILAKEGATTVMSRTGHSLIKSRLKELNAHLAGEMSGHIFFAHRYYGFDDAMHTSARLVEILSNSTLPLSKMLADIPQVVSTPEIRMDCPEEIKFRLAELAKSAFPEYQTTTIDGVRVRFPQGWGLVRASNTQPALVLRFEATTAKALNEYQQIFETRLNQLRAQIS